MSTERNYVKIAKGNINSVKLQTLKAVLDGKAGARAQASSNARYAQVKKLYQLD